MQKLLIFFILLPILISLGPSQLAYTQPNNQPMSALININDIAMWVRADGFSANNPQSLISNEAIQWGVIYPRGTPVGLVFVDGFIWGGFVQDGLEPQLRVGGHNWLSSGLQTGSIVSKGVSENQDDPRVNRVWRYRPDWQSADLKNEAFDILISRPDASMRDFYFSDEELQLVADSLREAYQKDLAEWPGQKGAPFYDTNGNNIFDEGEEPGLLDADQVVWFVANDLNSSLTVQLHGSPPIGMEMQVTLWAYNHDVNLQSTIFRRVRLIYKGTEMTPPDARIDSMAVGIYSEVDIGTFTDDFAGTDTTLQMTFAYNSNNQDLAYQEFGSIPPAVGYSILYGPILPTGDISDSAIFDFSKRIGFENLRLTGSWINSAGDADSNPTFGNYRGTIQYYNVLNGFRPRPEFPPVPFRNPFTGEPTKFTYPGDPLSNTGWVDQLPSNKQIDMTMANFNMALGDTQEVVFTLTAGLGADRLHSINVMKFFARKAKEFADGGFEKIVEPEPEIIDLPDNFQLHQNFPNPFNPTTEIQYDLPVQRHVNLSIYNILGQKIKTLVNEIQEANSYSVVWNGTNSKGVLVPSGIYFYELQTGIFNQTKSMLFLR